MSIAEKSIQSVQSGWFDELIAAIRTHQLQLETNTATDDIKSAYHTLMNGSSEDLAMLNKISANRHFIKGMILKYIALLQSVNPLKLAFDMDDSEVLVWAEIKDDDEQTEDLLLMAEAEVNAIYHQFGYDLTSTIVEQRDNLPIPNHYAVFRA